MQLKKQARKATANADRQSIPLKVDKFNPDFPIMLGIPILAAQYGGGITIRITMAPKEAK